MIEYDIEKVEKKTPKSITCDVCKTKYCCGDDDMEIQEFTHLRFIGGFSSIFGDGVQMKGDICQHCIKDKLGEY